MELQIDQILNNKNKHHIFVCGEEDFNNDDWVKATLDTELYSIAEKVDIPKELTNFVIATDSKKQFSSIDEIVIDYCNQNNLDYVVFLFNDDKLIQFFKSSCGYALIFGSPKENKLLNALEMTFTTLNIPFTVYE